MRFHLLAAALAAGATVTAQTGGAQAAPSDTTPRVTFGAFVDGYFAWDVGRPPSFDRSFAGGTPFTTQPARHNEFNVNLAFVGSQARCAALPWALCAAGRHVGPVELRR